MVRKIPKIGARALPAPLFLGHPYFKYVTSIAHILTASKLERFFFFVYAGFKGDNCQKNL